MCFVFRRVLEIGEHILDHALVERAEIGRLIAEGVFAEEVVEIPVDELPIEAVVVGDESLAGLAAAHGGESANRSMTALGHRTASSPRG